MFYLKPYVTPQMTREFTLLFIFSWSPNLFFSNAWVYRELSTYMD